MTTGRSGNTGRSGDSEQTGATILVAAFLFALLFAVSMQAQSDKIGPNAPPTYDNRYEVYGGLNFMNFQAGQNLPTRMNLGGGELEGTYWLSGDSVWAQHLGVTLDYRFDAGTTPVFPSPGSNNPARKLVQLNIGQAGVQWRGPKNRYANLNFHALGGVGAGDFHGSSEFNVGLYSNRVKPMGAVGASLDYNRSKNLAIRLQPDLVLEHFGTETREFFALSGGVIYRFGKR